jgi:hypothetical protein
MALLIFKVCTCRNARSNIAKKFMEDIKNNGSVHIGNVRLKNAHTSQNVPWRLGLMLCFGRYYGLIRFCCKGGGLCFDSLYKDLAVFVSLSLCHEIVFLFKI